MDEHMTRRRRWRFLMIGFLLTGMVVPATGESPPVLDASMLLGTWTVDLRPTPGAEPYFQELVVTSVDGNRFEGRFYGTPVTEARINMTWGKIRIAFVTADGSGDYHHAAVLEGETLEGLTNSTGRDFLSYWSAAKKTPQAE